MTIQSPLIVLREWWLLDFHSRNQTWSGKSLAAVAMEVFSFAKIIELLWGMFQMMGAKWNPYNDLDGPWIRIQKWGKMGEYTLW